MTLLFSIFFACTQQVSLADVPASGSPPEADRQAILAMAGDYSVRFRFEETASSALGYELAPIYRAEATEAIRVIEDRGDFIRLQHILVLDAGDGGPPELVKHWRQDWTWQDTELRMFRGRDHFTTESRSSKEVRGQWSQAVFQVSDQPRYESLGRWIHVDGISIWRSSETWRPLPRREASVRADYQVLATRNTHIISAQGWVHQQESRKLVLDEDGQPASSLAIEHGLNRYQRSTGPTAPVDFEAADRYWSATQEYWAAVRAAWGHALDGRRSVRIADRVNGRNLARALLSEADKLLDRPGGAQQLNEEFFAITRDLIENAVQAFDVPSGQPKPSSW